MNRQPFGLVWWEKVWSSWSRCPLCPRHQVGSVGITIMAGHQCIISAKDNAHLSDIVFQVRAGVCRQLFCKGKWKIFPQLSSWNISCSERELLLVLDQCSEWCVRLLGKVRNKQGGPELHRQGGSMSEYLREEDGGVLVVQGQRPRLLQLGLLFTSRAGPCINLQVPILKGIIRSGLCNIQCMGMLVWDCAISMGRTTGGAQSLAGCLILSIVLFLTCLLLCGLILSTSTLPLVSL